VLRPRGSVHLGPPFFGPDPRPNLAQPDSELQETSVTMLPSQSKRVGGQLPQSPDAKALQRVASAVVKLGSDLPMTRRHLRRGSIVGAGRLVACGRLPKQGKLRGRGRKFYERNSTFSLRASSQPTTIATTL